MTGKSIAVAGYQRIFENGPEPTPTGSAEWSSDHRGGHSDSEMYTPEMIDEEGRPILSRAPMSTEQVPGQVNVFHFISPVAYLPYGVLPGSAPNGSISDVGFPRRETSHRDLSPLIGI
jgi:hypothetical protein